MENNLKIIEEMINKRKSYLEEKMNDYIEENDKFFSTKKNLSMKEKWDKKIEVYMNDFNEDYCCEYDFENGEELNHLIEEKETKISELEDKIDTLQKEKEDHEELLNQLEEINIFNDKKWIQEIKNEHDFLKTYFNEKEKYNFEVYVENIKIKMHDSLFNIFKIFPNKKVSNINFFKATNFWEIEKIILHFK